MNKQQLLKAAQDKETLYFEPFEKNPGIIELRKIARETKPNTGDRMSRAQLAMPYVKKLWENMSSGLQGLAMPKPMKDGMNRMFNRLKTDKQFAIKAYNAWPILADRYGYGKQMNGKPRLSFVLMNQDPLCREMIK